MFKEIITSKIVYFFFQIFKNYLKKIELAVNPTVGIGRCSIALKTIFDGKLRAP